MRKLLLLLLPLVLLVLPACQEADAPAPDENCLLRKEASSLRYDGVVYEVNKEYTYNSQNQLISMETDSLGHKHENTVLSYDAQGRLKSVTGPYLHFVNEYNEQNLLVKQTKSYKDYPQRTFKVFNYYTFLYNGKKELIEARNYRHEAGKEILIDYWKYTYKNGNTVTITSVSPEYDMLSVTVLTHDNKPAPLQVQVSQFIPEFGLLAHNITRYRQPKSYEGHFRYTEYDVSYTYTRQNLPATATITPPNGISWVVQYEYDCR